MISLPRTEAMAAAVRAIVTAQKALRADPSLARKVGLGKFPKDAAELIANVVARDVEFYEPSISEERVDKMNRFAESVGRLFGAGEISRRSGGKISPIVEQLIAITQAH